MQKLLDGARRFQQFGCSRYGSLFRQLAQEGQRPHTLFITCADSRVVAELVTDSQPGELFVVKNVGNIVPPAGIVGMTNATAAAVEFAAEVLRVGDIVVCGHSQCGAISALLHPASNGRPLPHLASWLELADPVREAIHPRCPDGEVTDECLRRAEEINVLLALENLRTYAPVQVRLDEGSLRLHGWFFDIATGTLRRHDADLGRFVPLVTSPSVS